MKKTLLKTIIILTCIGIVIILSPIGCKKTGEKITVELSNENKPFEEKTPLEEKPSEEDMTSENEIKTTRENEEGTPTELKYTIAVISTLLDHPWSLRCKEGALKAGEDLCVNIIFTAPNGSNAIEQQKIINQMLNYDVDAILVSAIDAELLKKPISDAISTGIPVFGFDSGVPKTDILFSVSGWEPETSGKNIGEGLANEIGKKGKVAILTADLNNSDSKERREAIEEVLDLYQDIEILGIYANENDFIKGLTQCESILKEHPDLAGFAGDDPTCIPVACQAVINAELGSKIAIWGIGMPVQNAQFIKDGIAKGVFTVDPAKMTYIGIVTAYKYLKYGTLPKPGDDFGWGGKGIVIPQEKTVYSPNVLLTLKNVDEYDF